MLASGVAGLGAGLPARAAPQDGPPAESSDWCHGPPPEEYRGLERVDAGQAWFDVYRIRPGIFAIYEPHQFEQVLSYLIVGERRALLFDTGLGVGRIGEVVHGLTRLPVTVLSSHTHFDHVGGNAEFEDVWNEDTKFSRASARGGLDDYARATFAPDRLCGALPEDVKTRDYVLRPWKVSHRVHDGERIDLGGRSLEVLFTPGHAPDSLCLLDRANGLLFTGDTFYLGPIYLFAPGTDFAAYERSVGMLARLAPSLTLLLPAHTIPVADPGYLTALRDAVRSVRDRTVTPVAVDGQLEYRFGRFSLLLAPDQGNERF